MDEQSAHDGVTQHYFGAMQVRRDRDAVHRALETRIISVANIIGAPVHNASDNRVGKVSDVVVRWESGTTNPPVVGVLVRTGKALGILSIDDVTLEQSCVRFRTTAVVVATPERGDGRMALARDVIDHQLVDVAGVQVVRAADAYLTDVGRGWELAGVDVGLWAFLRRVLGRRRTCPLPVRSINWADLQAFVSRTVSPTAPDPGTPAASAGEAGSSVRMTVPAAELQTLRAKQVEALLDGLGRPQQAQLASLADSEAVAQVLHGLDPAKLDALLAELDHEDRARLLTLLGGLEAG